VALSLAAALRRETLGRKVAALALVAPLLLLLLFSFCLPIAALLTRAVYDPTLSEGLPRTAAALAQDEAPVPGDPVFQALAEDLHRAQADDSLFNLARALNTRLPGARSHLTRAPRSLGRSGPVTREAVVARDPFWGDPGTWFAIRQGAAPFTATYLLSAFDLRALPGGGIGGVPPGEAIYRDIFVRTFAIAAAVTVLTVVMGFPLAWLMTAVRPSIASWLVMLVLLPFWTSILVRTASWTVLLQRFGVVNDLLLWLGITGSRLDLMYSRTGMMIAMTHIQLPFTLLPIYSVMRTIHPAQMRAAASLGARPLHAFLRVYLPQVAPGVAAGCLLTFILCLGYFITPALVGGARDQLISGFIADYINVDLNWQMAASLSCVLLVATLLLYAVFARLLGVDRLQLV
jgi:putative spermidine/putrescine transport system permease protein